MVMGFGKCTSEEDLSGAHIVALVVWMMIVAVLILVLCIYLK